MFYLHMKAVECGISTGGIDINGVATVRQAYDSLEAAKGQAKHDIANNTRTPVCILDENGKVLINYED